MQDEFANGAVCLAVSDIAVFAAAKLLTMRPDHVGCLFTSLPPACPLVQNLSYDGQIL
jgi:hypothetical protein